MNMNAIRSQAKSIGVKGAGKMRKDELIRAIQHLEGHQPCFAAAWRGDCQQADCAWRSDCLEKNQSQ